MHTGKTGTNVLQKVLVPVIQNDECRRWHHQKHIRVELHDEMFCAGHRNGLMDACLVSSHFNFRKLGERC